MQEIEINLEFYDKSEPLKIAIDLDAPLTDLIEYMCEDKKLDLETFVTRDRAGLQVLNQNLSLRRLNVQNGANLYFQNKQTNFNNVFVNPISPPNSDNGEIEINLEFYDKSEPLKIAIDLDAPLTDLIEYMCEDKKLDLETFVTRDRAGLQVLDKNKSMRVLNVQNGAILYFQKKNTNVRSIANNNFPQTNTINANNFPPANANNFPTTNTNNFPQTHINNNNFPPTNNSSFPTPNSNNFPATNTNNFPQTSTNNNNFPPNNSKFPTPNAKNFPQTPTNNNNFPPTNASNFPPKTSHFPQTPINNNNFPQPPMNLNNFPPTNNSNFPQPPMDNNNFLPKNNNNYPTQTTNFPPPSSNIINFPPTATQNNAQIQPDTNAYVNCIPPNDFVIRNSLNTTNVGQSSFASYFKNLMTNQNQVVIINLDGQYVTFQTIDEKIKFVLFLKDATQNQEDIQLEEDEVQKFKKINGTMVVFLKNKCGCVVYWNNEKVSQRFIQLY